MSPGENGPQHVHSSESCTMERVCAAGLKSSRSSSDENLRDAVTRRRSEGLHRGCIGTRTRHAVQSRGAPGCGGAHAATDVCMIWTERGGAREGPRGGAVWVCCA